MIEQEIPRVQWQGFCEAFSREHHGWLASVGVMDTRRLHQGSQAARALVRNAVFDQLSFESETGVERVAVKTIHPDTTQRADRPERIFFEETEDGAHLGLRIDTAAGRTLLLSFRSAARPEQLDGLSEFE